MATFWVRVAHSVDHMFSLYLTICNFSYFPSYISIWHSTIPKLVNQMFRSGPYSQPPQHNLCLPDVTHHVVCIDVRDSVLA